MAFSLQNFIRTTQTRDGSPRFVITLSAPASALIAAILIVIVAWCFFMGFMVGRGQNPEKHLEEIAAIVGQAKNDEAAAPQGDAKPGDAATAGDQNGENAQAKDKSQPDAQASPDGQPDQGTGDQQAADAAASDTRTGAQAPLKDAIRQQWTACFPDAEKAIHCVRCGKCEAACPQHLPIRNALAQLQQELDQL